MAVVNKHCFASTIFIMTFLSGTVLP